MHFVVPYPDSHQVGVTVVDDRTCLSIASLLLFSLPTQLVSNVNSVRAKGFFLQSEIEMTLQIEKLSPQTDIHPALPGTSGKDPCWR